MFIEGSICMLDFSDFEFRIILKLCLNAKGVPSPKNFRDQWRGHGSIGDNPPTFAKMVLEISLKSMGK